MTWESICHSWDVYIFQFDLAACSDVTGLNFDWILQADVANLIQHHITKVWNVCRCIFLVKRLWCTKNNKSNAILLYSPILPTSANSGSLSRSFKVAHQDCELVQSNNICTRFNLFIFYKPTFSWHSFHVQCAVYTEHNIPTSITMLLSGTNFKCLLILRIWADGEMWTNQTFPQISLL